MVTRTPRSTSRCDVLVLDGGGALRLVRLGLLARLWTKVRGPSLDRQLAEGTQPDVSAPLTLHAQRLLDPDVRRQLARDVEHLVAVALRSPAVVALGPSTGPGQETRSVLEAPRSRPAAASSPKRTMANPTAILAARSELRSIADRLVDGGPVAPAGVAATRQLLADGAGPLYLNLDHTDARSACQRALEQLSLTPVTT